jgi:hypothetical protein
MAACSGEHDATDSSTDVAEWTMVREAFEEPSQPIRSVDNIALAPDGRAFVFPWSDATAAWIFDSAGKYIGQFGRAGKGPGEFAAIRALGFFGDTTWVYDSRNQRISYFSRTGEVIGSTAALTSYAQLSPSKQVFFMLGPFLRDGSVAVYELRADRIDAPNLEPWVILRIPRNEIGENPTAKTVLDSALLSHTLPPNAQVIKAGKKTFYPMPVWTDQGLFAAASNGSIYATVNRKVSDGNPSSFMLTIRPVPGPPKQFSIPYTPLPITEADVDSAWVAYRATMGTRENNWPTEAELRAQYGRVLSRPAHHPAVRKLLVSNDSTIWLERPSTNGMQLWEIYDLNAKLIARVEVSKAFQPLAASKRALYGKEVDANGVESIVRYRVR